ncbi:MAG: hypothetical protein QHG99_05885 [Methanomicrobiales archaeon]|jgi:hypothetical protein|nr:hypothetical protein [Methanomicrobiales archaeon]
MKKIFVFLIAIACILTALSAGCVSIRKTGEGEGTEATPEAGTTGTVPAPPPANVPPPATSSPPVTETPAPRSSVVYTDETIPPMDFPITKEKMPSSNATYSGYRTQIFSASHALKYTNIAFIAEVANPPFIIDLSTQAEDPNPWYSFLIVTVRDAETKEVLAEDGFGRRYSTDRSKEIILYRAGKFHVNVYGARVRVDIRIITGDPEAPAATATPVPAEEEFEY